MNKIIIYYAINFLLPNFASSQPQFTDNYPLKVGNVFVFREYVSINLPQIVYHTAKITNDTTIGSKKYYIITDYFNLLLSSAMSS